MMTVNCIQLILPRVYFQDRLGLYISNKNIKINRSSAVVVVVLVAVVVVVEVLVIVVVVVVVVVVMQTV
jgi:hypothetical protein